MATIEVDCIAYYAFYEVLRDVFLTKEMNGQSPYGRGNYSPDIWKHPNRKTGTIKALEIFGEGTNDPCYFYRMKSALNPAKVKKGKINATALYKALEYIGIRYPKGANINQLTAHSVRAELLFEEFKRTHLQSIPIDNATLSVDQGTLDETKNSGQFRAVFRGTITQGECTDACELEIHVSNERDVRGKFTVEYEPDGLLEAVTGIAVVEGKLFYNRYISLIYHNPDALTTQCGVVFLELSSFRDTLTGEFIGYYSPISPKRGACKGTLNLKNISI